MSNANSYYVYEIIDPRTNHIIYVGKGKGQRYLVHEKRAVQNKKDINPKLANKLRKIFSEGLQPMYIFVQKGLTEEEAYALEQQLTFEIGLDNLCNLKHGGTNGATFTEETREKMRQSAALKDKSFYADPERNRKISQARTGAPKSDATRKKLSDNLIGKSFVDRFGEERAAEIGKKIRDAQTGQKRPKQSQAMKGRFTGKDNPMYGKKQSDELKEAHRQYFLSENNPGKNKTEETKRKISESKKGKPGHLHTEEYKKMMSEGMKRRWEERKNVVPQNLIQRTFDF